MNKITKIYFPKRIKIKPINTKKNKHFVKKKRFIKDILFINGYNPVKFPHSYHYRVLHQKEQLELGFLECDEYFYLSFEPIIVRYYRVIIISSCPWTEKIGEAISLAKNLNKKVLFDIDDLIFINKYRIFTPFISKFSEKQKEVYVDRVNRVEKTLKLCQGAITTTETLAKEIKYYIPKVLVNHNVASEKMWRLSQQALSIKNLKRKDDHIIIGYFCTRITHNRDLEMIKPALLKILKEYKNVTLLLFGEFSFDNIFNEFSSQISMRKIIDWEEIPKIISNININIIPIENSTINLAKSENQWIEASLVKVPTIASNYGEFKKIIKQNETGFLCTDLNDWYLTLKTLIKNDHLRKNIGLNAYQICKEDYNTIYTHKNIVNFIN